MRVSPLRGLTLSLLAAGFLLSAAPQLGTPLKAQVPGSNSRPSLVLQAGQLSLDIDGLVVSARAEFPLDRGGRWLLVPGITYAHYTRQSPIPQIDFFAPEALVHLQLGQGRVRPGRSVGASASPNASE